MQLREMMPIMTVGVVREGRVGRVSLYETLALMFMGGTFLLALLTFVVLLIDKIK